MHYLQFVSRLTGKNHWDFVHLGERERMFSSGQQGPPFRRRAAGALKRLLGPRTLEKMSAYEDYLLWNVILPKYVPRQNGAAAVEIGSAPGEYIAEFSRRHGFIPHGIEYSEIGVEVNRKVFSKYGFDPDNVIHADVFSPEFGARFRGRFDVVVSKGFVEHFDDLTPVIDRHVKLLRPGGYLVVTVPNLRGANNLLARFFDGEAIPRHNTSIMRKSVYAELFDRQDLKTLFCNYYGTFSLYLFTSGDSYLQKRALKAASKIQPLLNLAFRALFGPKGAESAWFSPFLIYIGKKCRGRCKNPQSSGLKIPTP